MKNTFGNALTVTLFGESHGPAVGAVLDGLAPGIPVDEKYIAEKLSLRRPYGKISTARREADAFELLSGVYNGKTTGTPLCILIPNADTKSADYEALRDIPRPGHADFTAQTKFHGFQDPRGGGHFSARQTAALVAAGAVVQTALEEKGILIGTHIFRCAGISDRGFMDPEADIRTLCGRPFPVLDEEAGGKMRLMIEQAAAEGDSVGGVLETMVIGFPGGCGEPWFDSLEGMLSHMLFSVPAVKGVEFGDGFAFADLKGSAANDAFCLDAGQVKTATNRNGGINGGISNGMPILFRCAVKPTPSISKPQKTLDLKAGELTVLRISGRHDPCVVHRARAVVDAVTALVLADVLTGRFGTDYLGGI